MAIMQNCRRIRSALVVHTLPVLQKLMCGLSRLTCRRQPINGYVRYIVHVQDKLQQNEITLARRYACAPASAGLEMKFCKISGSWQPV